MSINFADAEPVRNLSAGRKAEPNPYAEIVNSISLKAREDGKSVAKSFTFKGTDVELKKALRQLGEAGKVAIPQCTVMKNVGEADKSGAQVVTFWTVPVITKTRKPVETPTETTVAL